MAERPIFSVHANGRDITSRLSAGGAISLTVVDGSGLNSDSVQIVIDDKNGRVEAPRTGVTLDVFGGTERRGIRHFGSYIVDQVDFSGYPQQISISAAAADAKGKQKERRQEHHEDTTYGEVFRKIAGRNGWAARVAQSIASKQIEYEAQAEEDDISFATRLGRKVGAVVTVKDGNLVVVEAGSGESVSSGPLPPLIIAPGINLLTYQVTRKDKPKHAKVEASWFDRDKVERKKVEVQIPRAVGDVAFMLREPFQNEAEAKDAAEAARSELERGEGSASFEIDGDPTVVAERPVMVRGVRPEVDGRWNPTTVEHRFSADGPYVVSIQCELPDGGSE